MVPDLSFDNIAPVHVNAGRVRVIDRYRSPMAAPNVEYLFPQPPEAAAHDLIAAKIVPDGVPDRILRVYIDDASVVGKTVSPDDGVMGVFRAAPGMTHHARLSLRFELADRAAPDIVLGHADIVAERDLTLPHGVSPNERNMAFFEMEEHLLKDAGDSLKTVVGGTFGRR